MATEIGIGFQFASVGWHGLPFYLDRFVEQASDRIIAGRMHDILVRVKNATPRSGPVPRWLYGRTVERVGVLTIRAAWTMRRLLKERWVQVWRFENRSIGTAATNEFSKRFRGWLTGVLAGVFGVSKRRARSYIRYFGC